MKSAGQTIKFSAPGKVHLLGEHSVVYGKPALLTTVDLRATVTVIPAKAGIQLKNRGTTAEQLQKTIEPIIKKHLKIKNIPPYQLSISSQIPLGSGLGSSASISASCIAALLTFLKVNWDLDLINELTYQAEKFFHGNPSGGDNSTVMFGGLVWFRKETPDLKFIKPLPFSIPAKLSKNFILINTGKPKETTREMVDIVSSKFKVQSSKFRNLFNDQERLVKELLLTIQNSKENQLIQIIREGEKNLEKMGVVSTFAKSIIRKIEKVGGTAKICGGGGKTGPVGVLLCYHPKPEEITNIAKSFSLDYFKTALGVEGLRKED